MCTGFEKLVMDADRLGSYQKILVGGLDTSEEALASDAYEEVAPGGTFLAAPIPCATHSDAFYEPKLSNSENVESWEEAGAEDMRMRAFKRWNNLLKDYEAPAIDPAMKEELEAFVARRKADMPDAWY